MELGGGARRYPLIERIMAEDKKLSPLDVLDRKHASQAFATGDGSTTAFAIMRSLGGFLEPVGWVTTLTNVYLNGTRQTSGFSLTTPNTLTFTLLSGLILCYTNVDVTFVYGGNTYLANSIRVDGLKYKATVGLEVDQQQITVAALATDTITSGAPFLQALRDGSFDGCEIVRYRIFFSDHVGGAAIGSVLLFKGRLGVVEEIGRTSAKLTVNSDLALLDIDMPRNVYQPTCLHTLYDSGCTLVKNAFGTNGTVGAGSTASVINWSGASGNFVQGSAV
ncbi:MAG: DUF2163 domain-containing protein [Xanthobacteraceae bacterium]